MALKSTYRLPYILSSRILATNSTHAIRLSSTQDPQKTEEDEFKLKGRIHSKLPMKVELKGGKRYLWCACGHSKNQPWCDGTHIWSRFRLKIKQHPVFFKAPKDMAAASMCVCKQTQKPPYCDGTHRRKEIKDAIIVQNP